MKKCILEVRDGVFHYEEGNAAICQISVSIGQGEKIAVVGSNGAGKSTFFLALNGVNRLEHGKLFHHGQEVDYSRKSLLDLRRNVGLVFQDPDSQIIASTVEGEISFGLFNIGKSKEEVIRKTDEIMEELQLTALAGRPPHFLSGGEKKQLSIADILVMEPEIILFDEPMASLDCRNTRTFKEQIQRLHQKDVTLIISTHDMDFVWEWAERMLVFSDGRLIADDVPERIFADDRVLEQASIERPLLYEAARVLQGGAAGAELPKNLEEFRNMAGLVKIS